MRGIVQTGSVTSLLPQVVHIFSIKPILSSTFFNLRGAPQQNTWD